MIDKIVGEDFYLDLSYTFNFLEGFKIKDIIEKHGPDRIFFATDFPLPNSKTPIKAFTDLGFDKDTEEKILYRNALEKVLS